MPVESGTTIGELNELWPLGSDPKSQGDDHIRLIKEILKLDAVSIDADLTLTRIVQETMSGGGGGWLRIGPLQFMQGTLATGGSNPSNITFTAPFEFPPVVLATVQNGANHNATVLNITETSAEVHTFNQSGNPDNVVVGWFAFGVAPSGTELAEEVTEVTPS